MKDATGYELIGFRQNNKEYLVKSDINDLNKILTDISTFYKRETSENIQAMFDKIIWLTEDDYRNLKDKKYIKNNNEGLTLLFLMDKLEPEKVKKHMKDLLNEYKEAFLAKFDKLRNHIEFDDKNAYKKVDSHFVKVDDILYCRFLNHAKNTSYKFKIVIDLDKDLIEVAENNSVKTYDRTNI